MVSEKKKANPSAVLQWWDTLKNNTTLHVNDRTEKDLKYTVQCNAYLDNPPFDQIIYCVVMERPLPKQNVIHSNTQ
jgi:hypothetical protein